MRKHKVIKILVPTKPDDTHSIYAKLALEKIGHKVDLWYTADFPSQQTHSLEIAGENIEWNMKNFLNEPNDNQYDVVWYRRPSKPILPKALHPDDRENARKENAMLYHSLWQIILPNAVWVNPVNSASRVSSKLLQLKLAANIGMTIPKTLVSNDPHTIKEYIKQNENNVIYKPLYPVTWLNKNEIRLTYTSQISVADLPSDEILQSTPGIFQEKINKKYELRITYFGINYVAVKINSQAHAKAKLDWRAAPTHELTLSKVTLPAHIDTYCRRMMKELGIVFGCFDFIVTPNNEYYFLEVNEQGQFLWIEEVNPEIKMLEPFVKFLLSYHSASENSNLNLSLQDFEVDMRRIKNYAENFHQNPSLF